MKKPFIALATLTLGLTFGALMALPVAALDGTARDTSTDDGVMPISETDNTTSEATGTTEIVDETTVTTDETTTDLENLEEAGTSGEAEVVCTEEGDEDCAAEVETTEEEMAGPSRPSSWPPSWPFPGCTSLSTTPRTFYPGPVWGFSAPCWCAGCSGGSGSLRR